MKYFILIVLFFSGCSIKEYTHTQAKIITVKTPKLKYSDLGYVRSSGEAVNLELYVAGKMVQNIKIDYLVCMNEGCMSKSAFNKAYLSASYPDELLQNIILSRPIYDGKNIFYNENGFTQSIAEQEVEIEYRVNAREMRFRDKKNNILFKIKESK